MIQGLHAMFYSSEAEELRSFLHDKLGLTSVDIGGGWLVFGLPEAEVGIHPVDPDKGRFSGTHHISFYCDDIQQTVDELSAKGVECTEGIRKTDWGLAVRIPAPGGFEIDLYQRCYEDPRPNTTERPQQGVERWVESVRQRLLKTPKTVTATRPEPGQWSAKEVLGHLIDSAANNHRRFVEAQLKDDLVFPGYDQERWVAAQGYQYASWTDLIALWSAYNLHLAHVVASMPEDVLRKQRANHTLDRIALQKVSPDAPVSLEYLIGDYYRHLEEHLAQLFSACGQ